MSRAMVWIAIALAVGAFFPTVGAFMLNPFGALIIGIFLVLIVVGVGSDTEE